MYNKNIYISATVPQARQACGAYEVAGLPFWNPLLRSPPSSGLPLSDSELLRNFLRTSSLRFGTPPEFSGIRQSYALTEYLRER